MAAQVKSFPNSHSNTVFKKDTSPQTSKMRNMATESGHEFLKAFIRERTTGKENAMESKPFSDSKKTCVFAQNLQNNGGKELLKVVVRKGTEKLNIKENKSQSGGTHAKKVCFCSPTTHEGSFRCHLHRVSATKKLAAEKKSNLRLNSKSTHSIVEFKPQLSRFGRIASAEVGKSDSPVQLSRVGSA